MTVVPLKPKSGLGPGEHHPPTGRAMRGGVQQGGRLHRAEGRPPGVADHVGEPGSPAKPDHPAPDPAMGRPEVQDRPAHQRSRSIRPTSALPIRTSPGAANRDPAGANRGTALTDGSGSTPAGTTAAPAGGTRRPAGRRRGAAASYSATFSGRCSSSSARSHSSAADAWPRHRTR
jgi:hypothetical protein